MTIEEAIDYITHHAFIADDVKDMAIVALEKQIPKKPIKTIEHNIGYYECPYCENKIGTDIMTYQSNHCSYCGQRLDWE